MYVCTADFVFQTLVSLAIFPTHKWQTLIDMKTMVVFQMNVLKNAGNISDQESIKRTAKHSLFLDIVILLFQNDPKELFFLKMSQNLLVNLRI